VAGDLLVRLLVVVAERVVTAARKKATKAWLRWAVINEYRELMAIASRPTTKRRMVELFPRGRVIRVEVCEVKRGKGKR
jgi:hypothetical protein